MNHDFEKIWPMTSGHPAHRWYPPGYYVSLRVQMMERHHGSVRDIKGLRTFQRAIFDLVDMSLTSTDPVL